MKQIILSILFFISANALAQYPGAFYTFELIGEDGKNIDSSSKEYRLSLDTTSPGPTSIEICTDNKTWRLYKGDKNLFVANFLTVEKLSGGKVEKSVSIKFPPPLTHGEHEYYTNFYIGKFNFAQTDYKIRFPKKKEEWEALKEVDVCPDGINFNKYLDIRKYQK